MAGISSLGIASGLDLSGLVQKLVAAEGQPASARYDRQEAQFQSQISALGVFKSAVSEFASAQQGLLSSADFNTISAESGDSSLYTVSAENDAQLGNYSVEVQSLAKSQSLASKAFSSSTTTVGSGTLTFRFGSYDSGSNTFTANAEKTGQSVTIDSSNNTLSGIRDAVNAADIGVLASIVDDGTGQRLVFTSADSGAENGLEITVSGDADGNELDDSGLSQLAYDPTAAALGSGKNLSETVSAKDAQVVVNGLTITRPNNTIDGVIQGVSLDLKSESPGTTTILKVSQDTAATTKKVSDFVDQFNTLVGALNDLTSYDPETKKAGPLLGDTTVRSVDLKIRQILTSSVTGLDGNLGSLADIGISTQSDGTLKLDSSKLQAAIEEDSDAVARLFSKSGKVSDSLLQFTGSTDVSQPGQYAVEVSQLATQGAYTGSAIGSFPLTIDSTNDTFSIRVDGTDSATINLTQGSYNTADELIAEIQNRINNDSALTAVGASVSVANQSGQLQITSNRYGSSSSVEITSVGTGTAATLGLSVGAGTNGVDVVGTINGVEAIGSGQTLTGTGDAAGLAVDVLGGALGARGDLSFSKGVSSQLDSLINEFLGSDNVIDSRIKSLNDRVSGIGKQREQLSLRLNSLQTRLVSQFTALDTLIGQLQSTGNFLNQQLSNLPGSGSG